MVMKFGLFSSCQRKKIKKFYSFMKTCLKQKQIVCKNTLLMTSTWMWGNIENIFSKNTIWLYVNDVGNYVDVPMMLGTILNFVQRLA